LHYIRRLIKDCKYHPHHIRSHTRKEEADYHHVKDQFGQGVLELAERKVLAARETHPVRLHTRIDVEGKGQHQCQQESLRRGVIRQHRTDG